ncbi:MAG: PatB family C-S lyase [Candidatus Cloacimonetes bacterium]|nr:PatB family C-S lyase [Candidatus Cloacimonadota bacterium]
MKRDYNKIYDRKKTDCFKWDLNKEIYGKDDIISMWVADMDLPADPIVEQSIIDRARHPIYGYTFRNDAYFQAFMDWQYTRNHWKINRNWLLNSTSVVVSINMIIRALTQPGDKILICTPVYSQFFVTITDTGRQIVTSSLINDNDEYKLDFADIESKLAAGVKLLVFCSPHNPVGRVWGKKELEELARLCIKYDTIIVSDEIHSDLVYSEVSHTPLASLSPTISANTITCMSPGKTFNISGLSIGFIIIENEELRELIRQKFLSYHLMAANIFGITACHTAYSSSAPWLDNTISYLQANRDFLCNYISENIPQIKLHKPQGTYLVWLDFSYFQLSQKQLQCFLVHLAALGLDNGTKYGEEGEGFMRLNFACSRQLLQKALDQLNEAVKKLMQVEGKLEKLIDNYKEIEDCD